MSPWARRLPSLVAVVVLAGALAFVVGRAAGSGPATPEDRTMSIAEGLRCPVCSGESVASSTSAAAAQMRAEIRRQLDRGRTPEQVRSWFAERYGEAVILSPPTRGIGLVAWLGPLALLGVGLVLIVKATRRRERDVEVPA